ncbi:hypothetical protein OM392_14500 [Serratia bockelmannii]|uniref:hypothetical protein n=1 Tax=Serratia bockelmannii TaxID=2703793 RepID=UPI00223F36C5|nr:hypothetical protein [Serratia bockelmannii]MCW7609085.1 hypothetical protein [Serratia bockelmannii]
MAKSDEQRKADARNRKRAQRQREREAASSAAVSGRRRITFEVSDHIFEQIKDNCSARRPGKEPYSVDEYFELLAVQDINQLKRQLAELASHKCQCGESMPGPAGGCYRNGEAACGQTQIWRELMLKTL